MIHHSTRRTAPAIGPTRREALAIGIGAAAIAASCARPTVAAEPASPFLSSDIGALKRVLVHSTKPNDHLIGKLDGGVIPSVEVDRAAMAEQQASLMRLLSETGAEVIEVADALEAAIEATRPSGVFEAWLDALYPRLGADPAAVTADMILGRRETMQFELGPDGNYRHRTDDARSTMWTRDSAFMTPNGLVICNAANPIRTHENQLMRFLYAHSPMLKDYPVIFDGMEEGLVVEGGDAMVADEKTMFLGVGNRTDPRVAPFLARRLGMDIVTVQTVEREFLRAGGWSGDGWIGELNLLVLHLDTYFTLVGPKHGLALPYLMEAEYAGEDPLSRYVRGARADTGMDADDAEAALKMLKDFGAVRRYAAGTGAEERLGAMKFIDYLKADGYRITFTGGPRPETSDEDRFRHFMSVAYPEQRRQATNVVQAAPGRVIAYDGNPATKAALEADGVSVDAFFARDLWSWHGGPHCLTQPLERIAATAADIAAAKAPTTAAEATDGAAQRR
ncbi:MAG: hypothetical protein GC152_06225 [Alphaproteobacteria bacterium]|nr:hypothetical protein [Alphaproteobacteria bacterium]